MAAVASRREAASSALMARGADLEELGLLMAAMELPSRRSSATRKSNIDVQAEWARRIEAVAWLAAQEANPARRAGLVRSSRWRTAAPSLSIRRATPSMSAR